MDNNYSPDNGHRPGRRLPPGTALSRGRYSIEHVVAQGDMSAVYRAIDTRFNRPCAVKEMQDELLGENERAQALEWFSREATLLLDLNHPCIPRVRDFFTERDKHYLVMDFIDGRTLSDVLEQEGNVQGVNGTRGVPEARARSWARQICNVLGYLHRQNPPVIFRDLKPSNIMVTNRDEIKLIDFRIARTFQPQRQATFIMTIGYAPPEQLQGMPEPRTDIYALGATLHRVLTHHDPANNKPSIFTFPFLRTLRPDISPAFEQIVMKALQPDLTQRWANALEMERAIMSLSPITAIPPTVMAPGGQDIVPSSAAMTPVRTHLRTLPFCHVVAPDVPLVRTANWLQGAAAAGWPLPLALAHDLGLLLSQSATQLSLQKPAYLPFDEDTSAYLTVLKRLAEHPLVRDLPSWQPPLSDAVLSFLLARLAEGLELPDVYRLPSGAEGVRFVRALETRLADAKPAELWSQTPAGERPAWRALLSAENLARLEKNLIALKREELRFLALYGAPLTGTPDPRDLLDLLALTGLPPMARLALSQTLNLLPHISDLHTSGGLQTYPEGGYEGLARQGSLDSLLPTETAYPHNVFLHRVLNHEALYYGRERQPEQRRELIYLVGQVGWGLGGDGQVLVRALLLALSQIMQKRDYEVLYSFAGATLSEPHPLDKPGEIGRVLYYQEQAALDSEQVLQGVLQHLRSWRETYQRRLVFWVVSETFDADEAIMHESSYQALRAESEQQVWYIRVGPVQPEQVKRVTPPATARYFERWQVVESALLWTEQKAGSA